MLKKTITYVDYDDNTRVEDFYFNLTKAEITEMQVSVDGGLIKMIEKILSAKDQRQIVGVFKDIILRSYGEKSPDGRRFIKSQELRDAFAQTEAYVQLFEELSSNPEAAAAFVKGIIPKTDAALAPAETPAAASGLAPA